METLEMGIGAWGEWAEEGLGSREVAERVLDILREVADC